MKKIIATSFGSTRISPASVAVNAVAPDCAFLDVTKPPYNADPTGKRDSTEAINRAIDAVAQKTMDGMEATREKMKALPDIGTYYLEPSAEDRKVNGKIFCTFPQPTSYAPTVFLPAGTYLVKDTLTYSKLDYAPAWQIRIVGAGKDKTVIRLVDHAAGFSDPHQPKPVICFLRDSSSVMAMSNYLKGLTIHTGSGNTHAVGVDFFSSNSAAVREVRIRSGDGSGHAGYQISKGGFSAAFTKDLTVEGFDYGVELGSPVAIGWATVEHVELRGQRIAGVHNLAKGLSLRDMHFVGNVPAVITEGAGALTVVVDSKIEGVGSPAAAFVRKSGGLYVSNVEIRGFTSAIDKADSTESSEDVHPLSEGILVAEYCVPKRAETPGQGALMPRLAVEETPVFSPLRAGEKSVGVRQFGAKGDGTTDDSQAIQKAMDTGAAEIVFEPGFYQIDAPVTVPATVRRVDFQFCDLSTGPTLMKWKNQGVFVIAGETREPLFIQNLFAVEAFRGDPYFLQQANKRTLVLQDLHTQTLNFYFNSVPGGKVFIENCATTTGVIPGSPDHGRVPMMFIGQQVWARQLNSERGNPMILVDGGTLWVFGFKTEDPGPGIVARNNAKIEILGGEADLGRPNMAFLVLENSTARASFFTDSCNTGWACFGQAVSETTSMGTFELEASKCFNRGKTKDAARPDWGFVMPLYTSKDQSQTSR